MQWPTRLEEMPLFLLCANTEVRTTRSYSSSQKKKCARIEPWSNHPLACASDSSDAAGVDMDGFSMWQIIRVWFQHTVLSRLRPLRGRFLFRRRSAPEQRHFEEQALVQSVAARRPDVPPPALPIVPTAP